MRSIFVRNVEDALVEGLELLESQHISQSSRNGSVMVAPCPVITTYVRPNERVLFNTVRDCNPFFHLMESLWMLAGREDVEWITRFNSTFGQFSDDGERFNGAYGHRWRSYFEVDQLLQCIDMLRDNPGDRRVVLGMWDPREDLGSTSRDIPCNTHVYFDTIDGPMNMTVCCRSNDIWWGAYGANAVHMSMLHEVVASAAAVPLGVYRQFSNNYHLYTDVVPDTVRAAARSVTRRPYVEALVEPFPVMNTGFQMWFDELESFMIHGHTGVYVDPFFRGVAAPVSEAWLLRKAGEVDAALKACERIVATDWRLACIEWITRRIK